MMQMAFNSYLVKALQQGPKALKSIGNAVAYEAMQFSKIMSSSKGRDKICAITQYGVDLYVNCMKYSQEYSDIVE